MHYIKNPLGVAYPMVCARIQHWVSSISVLRMGAVLQVMFVLCPSYGSFLRFPHTYHGSSCWMFATAGIA